jgi:excisionase family DNA binding protein
VATTPDPTPARQQHSPGNQLLTPAEVAAILGGSITAATIVRRWRTWGLHAIRIGRELRFRESDLHTWINDHQA